MLDRLVVVELVIRTAEGKDKRQTFAALTDKGRQMVGDVRDLRSQIDRELEDTGNGIGATMRPTDIAQLTTVVANRLRRLR